MARHVPLLSLACRLVAALGPSPSEPPSIAFLSLQTGELISPLLLLHAKGQCSKEDPGEGCRGWGSCLRGAVTTEGHTAAVCLMLWKLILVGDVGMDMALATGTRRE